MSACDRTTAFSLLRELLVLVDEGKGGEEVKKEDWNKDDICSAIEDLVPCGKAKKALWARGVDVLSYSVTSLRLNNLKFVDTKSPRSTQVVRLQLNPSDTHRVLAVSPSNHLYMSRSVFLYNYRLPSMNIPILNHKNLTSVLISFIYVHLKLF